MDKIPVGKTISYAYNFAFGNLGTIIGLVWLPLVILTLLNFLPSLAGGGADALNQPAPKFSEGIGSLAVFLLSALLYAMIYTAVTRQALGLRQGTATIHFSLGMPEFRMFGAVLLLIALAFVLLTTYAGALTLFVATGNPALQIAAVLFALVGGCALVYALVRFSFLLIPVTAAEDHVSLARSWILTAGNFWRIFAVVLAVALPIYVIFGAGVFALVGKDLLAPVPAAIANNEASLVQHQMEIFSKYGPELIGLNLILQPFSLGLNLGASAFAYRVLARAAGTTRPS